MCKTSTVSLPPPKLSWPRIGKLPYPERAGRQVQRRAPGLPPRGGGTLPGGWDGDEHSAFSTAAGAGITGCEIAALSILFYYYYYYFGF